MNITITMMSVLLMITMLFGVKNLATGSKRLKVIDAIYHYNVHCIRNGLPDRISYDCMESYEETLFNPFSWGYKGIVPEDVYEKIKPFL